MYLSEQIDALLQRQLSSWPVVRDNYAALQQLPMRSVSLAHSEVILQYNPVRRRSSGARVDAASLAARPCFLCREHQPVEQEMVEWDGAYKIQVNPYPIFPAHLTVASLDHVPQRLEPRRIDQLLQLALELPDWVLFYNGPCCGASAPDHMHFQAGCKGFLPLCDEVVDPALWPDDELIEASNDGFIGFTQRLDRPLFFIRTESRPLASFYLARLQVAMMLATGSADEPMQNVLCWHEGDYYNVVVFPRRKHRPDCYGEGEGRFLISPASVDMGGVWTIAVQRDYDTLTATHLQDIINELCADNATIVRIIDNFHKT
jgi:hypothetical protein